MAAWPVVWMAEWRMDSTFARGVQRTISTAARADGRQDGHPDGHAHRCLGSRLMGGLDTAGHPGFLAGMFEGFSADWPPKLLGEHVWRLFSRPSDRLETLRGRKAPFVRQKPGSRLEAARPLHKNPEAAIQIGRN